MNHMLDPQKTSYSYGASFVNIKKRYRIITYNGTALYWPQKMIRQIPERHEYIVYTVHVEQFTRINNLTETALRVSIKRDITF